MTSTNTVPQKNLKETVDKDLVELAGYHAYRNYRQRDLLEINNKHGGANTNAVAIENPDVKAVTLNPAILPLRYG